MKSGDRGGAASPHTGNGKHAGGEHYVHSKAQWAWMFGTHQRFAQRWAEEVESTRGPKIGYHALPPRVGLHMATGSRLRG